MKGVREVKLRPSAKPKLMDIEARAFVVRLDQMDSHEWLTVDLILADNAVTA